MVPSNEPKLWRSSKLAERKWAARMDEVMSLPFLPSHVSDRWDIVEVFGATCPVKLWKI